MGELLRTTGRHRQFRMGDTVVRAVDGIDLRVGEGEFVSIMGSSGCGGGGSVRVPDLNLVENLTVLQNVQLQGMLGGRTGGRAATRRRAVALLEELGVGDGDDTRLDGGTGAARRCGT